MEFSIHKRKSSNKHNYSKKTLDIAYEFAKEINKELRDVLKAIILFGSAARAKEKSNDIDILLIVDDVSIKFNQELVQTYRIIAEQTVRKVNDKIHVTSMKFTSFWEYSRVGDPIALNILRDGIPLLDTGFFEPMQHMLHMGRLKPSSESMWSYYNRAPNLLRMSKVKILEACMDLYWAIIDAANAALMSINEIPPGPAHTADMLEDKLVKNKLLDKKYAWTMRKFFDLSKRIAQKELRSVSGKEYDEYFKEAKEFVDEMEKLLVK